MGLWKFNFAFESIVCLGILKRLLTRQCTTEPSKTMHRRRFFAYVLSSHWALEITVRACFEASGGVCGRDKLHPLRRFNHLAAESADQFKPPAILQTVCFDPLAALIRWTFWAAAWHGILEIYIANKGIMLIPSDCDNTLMLIAMREILAKFAMGSPPKPFSKVWRCSGHSFRPIQA
jgi:hypothetical protein